MVEIKYVVISPVSLSLDDLEATQDYDDVDEDEDEDQDEDYDDDDDKNPAAAASAFRPFCPSVLSKRIYSIQHTALNYQQCQTLHQWTSADLRSIAEPPDTSRIQCLGRDSSIGSIQNEWTQADIYPGKQIRFQFVKKLSKSGSS
ncbi:GL14999 [Drosophila persimilis]|uniref:GL14999 n=1 Tax=Drosophila persimilis TaxID=7234 RepID=B4H0K2_DROPE|nr:GL14999 [Drosophila persimilis]